MKKLYPLFVSILFGLSAQSQIISFPDPQLKTILLLTSPDFQIAKDLSGNFFTIDANNDGEIQISEALQVSFLDLQVMTEIEDMTGIENFTNLITLYASNYVSTINLNGLVNLETFSCSNNNLTSLDLTGSPNLKYLDCSWGHITTLNIVGLIHLEYLDTRATNPLGQLDLSSVTSLKTLYCSSNGLTSLNVSGLSQLQFVDCAYNQLTSLNFSGLSNLQHLVINNNQITSVGLSGLNNLDYLDCYNNLFSSIDLSGLTNLSVFNCSQNLLATLNLTDLINLQAFYCSANQLQSLDISNQHLMEIIEFNDNAITSLNLSGLSNLYEIACNENQLTTIDVSNLPNLQYLLGNGNLFTSIDVSANHQMVSLACGNNPNLTTVNIKNGAVEYFAIDSCPNLQYICADESQFADVQQSISDYNLTNCHVNSYCSFTPGGTFYTISGSSHCDEDMNGCSATDIAYPYLKLAFTDGTVSGNYIASQTGTYTCDVQDGIQTITPILENPDYYTVSPSSVSVTFPDTASPFLQDFCITPNGVHNDLEIMLIPLSTPRPGFDTVYQVIYKNKGNQTQSGSVNLSFDDPVLDIVSASPTFSSQVINSLSWNFTNLSPFESRLIYVILNLNSPSETPAVNGGDVLNFTATITSGSDDTPSDNTSIVSQIVRNSLDPNDKTCLEGTTITPAMIGNYVHYVIRFENTGTFAAENIVVSDVIDDTKFDITSLIPESGSHEFITRITGNKAEFIFENINLPFDDVNNDGYVAFKIKTKPTLVVGDTFSNSANIYFDYNFPITTNTATTIIQTLGTQDFDFSSIFSLSPVPTRNVLTITAKQAVEISSVTIYNSLGQLMQVNTNPNETIDVSGLKTGSYFIKISSDIGTASSKFIKE